MSLLAEGECAEAIALEIEKNVPEQWTSVTMLVHIDESGMMEFENSYTTPKGQTKHLQTSAEFYDLFLDLARSVETRSPDPVRRVTFTLDGSGKYEARYSYEEEGFAERSA